MKNIYFVTLLTVISCTNLNVRKEFKNFNFDNSDSLKRTILGRWGGPGESEPVFEIHMDSIYYFDRKASYPYRIDEGDLIIQFSHSIGVFKEIHSIGDTLIFGDDQGLIIKGYRFK